MTEKERLVSIISKASVSQRVNANLLADYMLKHGVTVKFEEKEYETERDAT